jgi:hypothetical protein
LVSITLGPFRMAPKDSRPGLLRRNYHGPKNSFLLIISNCYAIFPTEMAY